MVDVVLFAEAMGRKYRVGVADGAQHNMRYNYIIFTSGGIL